MPLLDGDFGGHWVAADSEPVFELARCPRCPKHDISGEPLPGHHHSQGQPGPVVRGGSWWMATDHSAYAAR